MTAIKWLSLFCISLIAILIESMFFLHVFDNLWLIAVIAVTLAGTPAVFASVFTNRIKPALLLLVVASLSVASMYLFYAGQFSYLPGRDALYDYQVIDILIRKGRIPFGLGVDASWVYSFYPFFRLLVSNFSILTGIDLSWSFILFSLLISLFPLLIFLITRRVFNSEKIALIAAIINIYSSARTPNGYSVLGMVFFYLFVMTLFSYQNTKKSGYFALSLVFLFALSGTHHVTLYLALLLVILLYIANIIPLSRISKRFSDLRTITYKIPAQNLFLLLAVGLIWPLFFASPVTLLQIDKFQYIFLSAKVSPTNLPLSSPVVSLAETIFMVASVFIVLLISTIGFLVYLVRDTWDKRFVAFSLFFATLFVVGFLARNLHPDVTNIWWRIWGPFFAAAGPCFGYFIVKRERKDTRTTLKGMTSGRGSKVVTLTILLCLASSYMLMIPREYLDFDFEKERGLLVNYRSNGTELYHAAIWFSERANRTYSAICDQPLYDFIRGYFQGNVTYNWDIYSSTSQLPTKIRALENQGVRYVFVDQLMSQYDESPTYLTYVSRVPAENLLALESNLSRIYDNGVVQICSVGSAYNP